MSPLPWKQMMRGEGWVGSVSIMVVPAGGWFEAALLSSVEDMLSALP